MPGQTKGSWAYLGDDGGMFEQRMIATHHAATYGTGDIIRCDINFVDNIVSFFKNGGDLGKFNGYRYPALVLTNSQCQQCEM